MPSKQEQLQKKLKERQHVQLTQKVPELAREMYEATKKDIYEGVDPDDTDRHFNTFKAETREVINDPACFKSVLDELTRHTAHYIVPFQQAQAAQNGRMMVYWAKALISDNMRIIDLIHQVGLTQEESLQAAYQNILSETRDYLKVLAQLIIPAFKNPQIGQKKFSAFFESIDILSSYVSTTKSLFSCPNHSDLVLNRLKYDYAHALLELANIHIDPAIGRYSQAQDYLRQAQETLRVLTPMTAAQESQITLTVTKQDILNLISDWSGMGKYIQMIREEYQISDRKGGISATGGLVAMPETSQQVAAAAGTSFQAFQTYQQQYAILLDACQKLLTQFKALPKGEARIEQLDNLLRAKADCEQFELFALQDEFLPFRMQVDKDFIQLEKIQEELNCGIESIELFKRRQRLSETLYAQLSAAADKEATLKKPTTGSDEEKSHHSATCSSAETIAASSPEEPLLFSKGAKQPPKVQPGTIMREAGQLIANHHLNEAEAFLKAQLDGATPVEAAKFLVSLADIYTIRAIKTHHRDVFGSVSALEHALSYCQKAIRLHKDIGYEDWEFKAQLIQWVSIMKSDIEFKISEIHRLIERKTIEREKIKEKMGQRWFNNPEAAGQHRSKKAQFFQDLTNHVAPKLELISTTLQDLEKQIGIADQIKVQSCQAHRQR